MSVCEGCGQIISDLDHALNEIGRLRAKITEQEHEIVARTLFRVAEERDALERENTSYRVALDSIRMVLDGAAHGDSGPAALIAIARVLRNIENVIALR